MNIFADQLRDAARRLDLPQPVKVRILYEMKYDLEDAFSRNLEAGMSMSEAAAAAARTFALSNESIEALIAVHSSPLKKLMNRLSGRMQTGVERGLVLLFSIVFMVLAARAIGSTDFFREAGIAVLPVAGIGLYVTAKAIEKLLLVFILRKHDPRLLRQGLDLLLFTAGINLVLGIGGYFLELYSSGGAFVDPFYDLIVTAARPGPGSAMHLGHFTAFVQRGSGLMLLTLMVTMAAALLWYFLEHIIQRIEFAETRIFLK